MSGNPKVQARVDPRCLEDLDAAVLREGVDRGAYVRLAIEYALETMPSGWRPAGGSTAQTADAKRGSTETASDYLARTLGADWRTEYTTNWADVAPGYDT